MPSSPGADADYKKLDEFLAGLSRDEIAYLSEAAETILESNDSAEPATEPTPEMESDDLAPDLPSEMEYDGQPSDMQEQADFAGDDRIEPNYLEE